MPHLSLKKQYWIAALVVGIFAAVNVVGFWFFVRPGVPPGTFAGVVSSVSSSTLAITDGKQHLRTFTLTPDTKITQGKNLASTTDITSGTFVMITAESPRPDAIVTKIRILSTNPFDRHHKSVTP